MNNSELMKTGEIARRSGLPVSTVRYYNRMGLIKETCRTPGRVRLFSGKKICETLKRIKNLSGEKRLDEIKNILYKERRH